MGRIRAEVFQISVALLVAARVVAAPAPSSFTFSTGDPDGKVGTASRPANGATIEIESGDDFVLPASALIAHATFTGLLTNGATANDVQVVIVEIYRVFPRDSVNPPSGHVPTRDNSPSDVAFDSRDSGGGGLHFSASVLSASFTVTNSVLNGINPIPNQTTGGEGGVPGVELLFDIVFDPPFRLPADHYFFVPQVQVAGGQFLWLSAPKPIVAPGTPFTPDLQSWIRNANLDPDWLRVGTDIIGAGTFNATFSLDGAFTASAPAVSRVGLVGLGLSLALVGTWIGRQRHARQRRQRVRVS